MRFHLLSNPVIFCFTSEEADWVIAYLGNKIRKHKILAPTAEAQATLLRHGLTAFDFFDSPLTHKNYYSIKFREITRKTQNIVRAISFKTSNLIYSFDCSYIDYLRVPLEYEIFETLYQYEFFKFIQQAYSPTHYIISGYEHIKLSGPSSNFFSLAGHINDYYAPRKKIINFYPKKRFIFNNLKTIAAFFFRNILQLPKIRKLLKFRIIKSLKKTHLPKISVDFLLFSAGFNLYYYHTFLKKIYKNSLSLSACVVTGKQSLEDELLLYENDIDFISLESFWNSSLKEKVLKEVQKINKKKLKLYELTSRIHDINSLPTPLKRAILFKINSLLTTSSYKFVKQAALAQSAVKATSPRLVVTTHDPGPTASTFVGISKKLAIPSLVFIHAWQDSALGMNHQSKYIAAWGKETANWYKRFPGKNFTSVFSTGFPFFDNLIIKNKAFWQKKQPPKSFHHPLRIGLLLTLYPEGSYIWTKFIHSLFGELGKKYGEYIVSVRLHQGQSLRGIQLIAKLYNISVLIDKKNTLEEFIYSNDVIISWDTTAFLWAMLFGKPLFCTTPFWGPGLSPVTKYKAAWEPMDEKGVIKKIEEMIKNPVLIEKLRNGQRKFLEEVIGKLDGNSSERLSNLVKKLSTRSHDSSL